MEIIREEAFRKQMKNGLSGGYLFFGDEDYLKAHAVRAARAAVAEDEGLAVFNDVRLDAVDFSASALIRALQPMPMMTEKKIVTVTGLVISEMKASELDALCEALDTLSEYDYNVLILSVPAGGMEEGTLKKPSATVQRFAKHLTPVFFETIPGARLGGWVGKHFAACGVRASAETCAFLVEYCGRSMFTLSAETEKLAYYALSQGREEVTREDVLTVSVGTVETDAYTLTNALMDGQAARALEALSVMKRERVEPVVIMGEITRVIGDMLTIKTLAERGVPQSEMAAILKIRSDYKVKLYLNAVANKSAVRLKRALSLCAEADAGIKQGSQGYMAIERLICGL